MADSGGLLVIKNDLGTARGVYVKWTESAKECYKIGCQCNKCSIPRTINSKCNMKVIVLETVRRFGAPEICNKQQTMITEDI